MDPFVVNRTKDDDIQANGKGVNVSLVLKMLGIPTTALGFRAGFTGNYIEDYLQEKAIQTDFIEVPGMTRINVFHTSQSKQRRIQISQSRTGDPTWKGAGLFGSDQEFTGAGLSMYLRKFAKRCSAYDFGRDQSDLRRTRHSFDYWQQLSRSHGLFALSPVFTEAKWRRAGVLVWTSHDTEEAYLFYGQQLLAAGAQNVLLSLGGEGAIFFTQDKIIRGNSPKGKVVNTACAGDTLLGTFLAGHFNHQPLEETLRKSLAAGSSTAFRKGLTDFRCRSLK